jgi:hypothetical protein
MASNHLVIWTDWDADPGQLSTNLARVGGRMTIEVQYIQAGRKAFHFRQIAR